MDSNAIAHDRSSEDIEIEAEPSERRRSGGGSAWTAVRVVLALAGGGAAVAGYIFYERDRTAERALAAATEALRNAHTGLATAQTRAAASAHDAEEAQARVAAADAHSHDLETQLTQAQTQQQQLGEQLTAANARAQEQEAVAARFREVVQRSGGAATTDANGRITLQLVDRVLFAAGESALTEQGAAVLTQVADILRSVPDKQVWIQGHTDVAAVPHPDRYATNWELSTARALSVVHFLQDQAHVDPRRLAVVGFAQYRPLVHGVSPRNRRIEIVLLPRDIRTTR